MYNNMGDSPRCRTTDPAHVRIFHFTVCQKPWYCLPGRETCKAGQEVWWAKRKQLEISHSLPVTPICTTKFDYKPIAFPSQDASLYTKIQRGCASIPAGCAKFK